ncbi:MAG: hypothetical protein K5751_00985 [Treponemataceae bacterium]|nr:hypothetical protein [Treponemataceae bacterium]
MTKKSIMPVLSLAFTIMAVVLSFMFSSCEQDGYTSNIESEKMFSIQYGNFEDETKLYSVRNGSDFSSGIYMSDGLFYISDSNAKKIMLFSSYGDLLAVYFNPETNPVPSFIQFSEIQETTDGTPSKKATQRATSFPFQKPEKIVVDKRKYLYVSDYVPEERYETSADGKQLLRQIVLRFSNDGTFIDYIGQQGSGGMPFPYIEHLYTTASNELVVICADVDGMTAFWYTADGFLLYKIPVDSRSLPVPESLSSQEIISSLTGIVPDENEHKLYLLIDYSKMEYDESSKVQFGISYVQSMLFSLNVTTGTYENPQVIPYYEQTISNDLSRQVYPVPYEFLGTTESGWFFFVVAGIDGNSLLMVNPDGQRVITRRLAMDVAEIDYYALSLSEEGIISALFTEEKEASVTWWRTDQIVNSFNSGK